MKTTETQRAIFKRLLDGWYLRKRPGSGAGDRYALLDPQVRPHAVYHEGQLRALRDVVKRTKDGRYVVSRFAVRQLHGNCSFKRIYRQHLKAAQSKK